MQPFYLSWPWHDVQNRELVFDTPSSVKKILEPDGQSLCARYLSEGGVRIHSFSNSTITPLTALKALKAALARLFAEAETAHERQTVESTLLASNPCKEFQNVLCAYHR